jgi:hypothetical protein
MILGFHFTHARSNARSAGRHRLNRRTPCTRRAFGPSSESGHSTRPVSRHVTELPSVALALAGEDRTASQQTSTRREQRRSERSQHSGSQPRLMRTEPRDRTRAPNYTAMARSRAHRTASMCLATPATVTKARIVLARAVVASRLDSLGFRRLAIARHCELGEALRAVASARGDCQLHWEGNDGR